MTRRSEITVNPNGFYSFPWRLRGDSVAMAQFGEVTVHERKPLRILRPYSFGILWKTKTCMTLKETKAYPVSPPGS